MTIDTMPAAQAVEKLIADYGKLVFHVILGMTSDWDESQDLTQDTFVQALRAIDAARQASGAHFHAKAWLLQVAVNMVRMSRRRRGSVRVVPFSSLRQEEQEETGIENVGERAAPVQPAGFGMGVMQDPADLIAERDAVQRAIARLPEAPRLCLLLSVVGGLSSHEIAQVLDLNEAAVRQRLSRARRLFQQLYLLESGEALPDRPTVKPQAEPERRPAVAAPSRPAMAAGSL